MPQFGQSPESRLKGLALLLKSWSHNRIYEQTTNHSPELNEYEVRQIKQLIYEETKRIKNAHPETLTEQILFLMLGAIRMQGNRDENYIWNSVDSAISTFIQPEKSSFYSVNILSFGLIFIMIILITINIGLRKETSSKFYPDEISQQEAKRNALGQLMILHQEISKGFCQIPQAAMLETKQRETYISYINEGQVNIDSADDLKKALTFVNCLYPQKLMNNPLNQ